MNDNSFIPQAFSELLASTQDLWGQSSQYKYYRINGQWFDWLKEQHYLDPLDKEGAEDRIEQYAYELRPMTPDEQREIKAWILLETI